jgi:hypothetical protein
MNAHARCPLVALVLFLTVTLAACAPHKRAGGIAPEELADMRSGPILVEASLGGALRVGEVEATRLDSGKLKLVVPLHNRHDTILPTQIKVSFKDEGGRQISGDETTWEVLLLAQGVTNHTVRSLRQKASRYHIKIRRHK